MLTAADSYVVSFCTFFDTFIIFMIDLSKGVETMQFFYIHLLIEIKISGEMMLFIFMGWTKIR